MRTATQIYETFRVAIHTHNITVLNFTGIRAVGGSSCHAFNNLALIRLIDKQFQGIGRRHFAANEWLTSLDDFSHLRIDLCKIVIAESQAAR